jgi:stage III sporulation protein SpoIIIAA
MSKYTKATLQKLESIFDQLDYKVRYEKGNFRSGYCIVEDHKIAVINRFFDLEGRVQTLLDILVTLDIDTGSLEDSSRAFLNRLLVKTANN